MSIKEDNEALERFLRKEESKSDGFSFKLKKKGAASYLRDLLKSGEGDEEYLKNLKIKKEHN